MAEPTRGFKSLRKKRPERPKISAPTLQPTMERRQSEAQEKLQRRMSMRLMAPIGLEDAPPMPSMPSQAMLQGDSDAPMPRPGTSRAGVDMRALEDPNLDVDAYVKHVLGNASVQDIDAYERELEKVRNRASADLLQNVNQNIDAFMRVSQHVKAAKAEMDNLRTLISDLRTTIAQSNAALGIEVDDQSSTNRKSANRSSIANLEALWSSQLQELWKRVEGSQKYLPAIPGRHVLHESGRWIELNSATWKPRRRVHLILLNDHFLAASDKKRSDQPSQSGDSQAAKTAQNSSQLVLDHCFPLNDVDISDFRSQNANTTTSSKFSSLMAQAVVIRCGVHSLTYAPMDTDREASGTNKSAFAGKLRKAIANIKKNLVIDAAEANPITRPSSMIASASTGIVPTLKTATQDTLVDSDGQPTTLRTVENHIYDLEIDVALQRFEPAVAGVEKLRSIARANRSNPSVQALIETKAQKHIDSLVSWLVQFLRNDQGAGSKVQKYTAWLIRLDLEQLASRTFLEARGAWIKSLTDKILYTGHLPSYTYQLSHLTFSSIKHTILVYNLSFLPQMSSACIAWAQERVREFNKLLALHLGCEEVTNEVREECLVQTRRHAKMLAEVNVDFGWLVEQGG